MPAKIHMTCTCCGKALLVQYEQWWNQDKGRSLCKSCAPWIQERENLSDGEMTRRYGMEGTHRETVPKKETHSEGIANGG